MNTRSAILRAEIKRDEGFEVSCALEMTETSVFVVTDALPSIGDQIHVRLSFPNTIDPLDVVVKVVQVRLASGPGTPSGFVGEFEIDGAELRETIVEVARRLRRPFESGISPPIGELVLLLVEDNQLIRDMFAYTVDRYFGQRGGRVRLDQAENANEARTLLSQRRYDLVIVDHFLPHEDGASFIAKLRADPELKSTSVVAMSVGGSDVRRATLEAGADIFLHKPIVLKDLFCTLEFLMDANRSDRGAA